MLANTVLTVSLKRRYALREAGIMDAFNEIPELKRFVGYYRLIQTPRDRTMVCFLNNVHVLRNSGRTS